MTLRIWSVCKITYRPCKSPGLVLLSQLHFHICERGSVNLVWPESPPPHPCDTPPDSRWMRRVTTGVKECVSDCVWAHWISLHLVSLSWGRGRLNTAWQSKDNTQGQLNTHKHKSALLTSPPSSSTLFCNLPSEPLEYPEEMTFQLKGI